MIKNLHCVRVYHDLAEEIIEFYRRVRSAGDLFRRQGPDMLLFCVVRLLA